MGSNPTPGTRGAPSLMETVVTQDFDHARVDGDRSEPRVGPRETTMSLVVLRPMVPAILSSLVRRIADGTRVVPCLEATPS